MPLKLAVVVAFAAGPCLVDSASFLTRDSGRKAPTKVWVASWPRSGSTTMFHMVLAGRNQDEKTTSLFQGGRSTGRSHFSLFEPCHWGLGNTTPDDRLAPELKGDCGKTMERLLDCDFKGIKFLFGWSRYSGRHTDISGVDDSHVTEYKPKLATERCKDSDLLVYKTVEDFGRQIDNLLPMLHADPALRVLVPVRDPRGIFASWKKRPWGRKGVDLLREMCDSAKQNIAQKHPRLRRVVYERLARDPTKVMQNVYEFLGLPFGLAQQDWIKVTFNAPCEKLGLKTGDFSACHTNSSETAAKWQHALTAEELDAFRHYQPCRDVAEAYGYPL